MDYFGGVVNQSARVSDAGHGGQIVVTEEVHTVLLSEEAKQDERIKEFLPLWIEDKGFHQLKGIKELVKIYERK